MGTTTIQGNHVMSTDPTLRSTINEALVHANAMKQHAVLRRTITEAIQAHHSSYQHHADNSDRQKNFEQRCDALLDSLGLLEYASAALCLCQLNLADDLLERTPQQP